MTVDLENLQRALREALLPIVRIAGEDTRLPMAERLAHYRCPAVGAAVMEDGEGTMGSAPDRVQAAPQPSLSRWPGAGLERAQAGASAATRG